MQRTVPGNAPVSRSESSESFCPECGQSLDLFRHSRVPPSRKSWEAWLFLAVGLGLVILFGLRATHVRDEMIGVDQQIVISIATPTNDAYGTASNQEMLRNDQKNPLLTYHALLRRDLNRNIAGLGFGLLAIAIGVSSVIRRRREDSMSTVQTRSQSVVARITFGLWGCGEILAGSLLRAMLILFALVVGGQVLEGGPPTSSLLDQALTRTADILTWIVGMLT